MAVCHYKELAALFMQPFLLVELTILSQKQAKIYLALTHSYGCITHGYKFKLLQKLNLTHQSRLDFYAVATEV
jgi:hypothetical protein